ncbi:MAG: VCBS repeat-containing protein [Planctomycetales bacterium]|nr:VCBS repeat-containing protein [Planctomycetales bacterium]
MRFFLLIAVSFTLGCTRPSRPTAPDAESPQIRPSQTSGLERPAQISINAEDPISNPELRDGEWRTEHLTEQIDRHLSSITNFLLQASQQKNNTSALVSDDFRGTALRPTDLVTVRDGDFVIRRADNLARSQSDIQGKAGFAKAIEQLLAGPDGAIESWTRCKFKVVSVDEQPDRVATNVMWQALFDSNDRSTQITSTWHCVWSSSSDGTVRLTRLAVAQYEEVETSRFNRFVDATNRVMQNAEDFRAQLGQSIDYWYDRMEHSFCIMPSSYQGISVADVNGDGLDDLFVPQPGGVAGGLPNKLYVQQSDGTTVDWSQESNLDWLIETHSALFVDFDEDGDQDVAVATVMGVVFAENDGHGRFSRRATKLTPDAPPMSLAAADYDNDGDLDLYVCCYSPRTSSPLMGRPIPYHDANNGGRNLLLRNDRGWRFRDVTKQMGMDANNRRFSFAASWEDFDNDGDMDIYVANDYGRNNLFRNDADSFHDVAAEVGVEDISAGMGVTWGDFNRDGWMDAYVSNMWSSAGRRIAFQRTFQSSADDQTLRQFQRHARGNSLFANRFGDGRAQFDDVSVPLGVTMGRWAWCSQFADINNDGNEDLLVANGFITQEKSDDL